MTPKLTVESTESMTGPVQMAVLAPSQVAFRFIVTIFASARRSYSRGLKEPLLQTSKSSARKPLLTAAGGGAQGNAFFNNVIEANLQKTLYDFLSSIEDQSIIDFSRLLKRI